MKIHTERFTGRGTEGLPFTAVLVHGAGEHSGRYGHVIEALTEQGVGVVTGDLPGHGRSGGVPGHVDSFEEYLDCLENWMREASDMAQGGPLVLIGHSMGGLIVTRFLEERAAKFPQLSGAVLSAPCLKLALEVPAWKRQIAVVVDKLWPRLSMPTNLQAEHITRSPEVIAAHYADPLIGRKASARWFQELNRAMELAIAKAGSIALPVLVIQAGNDKIVDPASSDVFYAKLPATEGNKFVSYPDCYHELFNEPERDLVLTEMMQWLSDRAERS